MPTTNTYRIPFQPSSKDITYGQLVKSMAHIPGFVGLKCHTSVAIERGRGGREVRVPHMELYAEFRSRLRVQ